MIYTIEEITRRIAPIAQKYRLPAVYLFGSYARGAASADSDIDLLVDTTGTELKSLLSLGALYNELEEVLEKRIDLITVSALEQKALLPSEVQFRDAVWKEKVSIYDAA